MKRFLFLASLWTISLGTIALDHAAAQSVCADAPSHLNITFTGVIEYHNTQESSTTPLTYAINLPDLTGHGHQAYIRFKKDDLDADLSSGFELLEPPSCKSCGDQYVVLKGHRLTIDLEGVDKRLKAEKDLYLAPLKTLAKKSVSTPQFTSACKLGEPPPSPDPMAGCVFLESGCLSPVFEKGRRSYKWTFKTRGILGLKRDSGLEERCISDGILLRVALKPEDKRVRLVSDTPRSQLVLKVDGSKPTEILIGNTLTDEICCPPTGSDKPDVDTHFKHHYMLVSGKPTKYLPHQTKTPCPLSFVDIKAIGGSNCLGSQWPY